MKQASKSSFDPKFLGRKKNISILEARSLDIVNYSGY
jgi:hypothetical protein